MGVLNLSFWWLIHHTVLVSQVPLVFKCCSTFALTSFRLFIYYYCLLSFWYLCGTHLMCIVLCCFVYVRVFTQFCRSVLFQFCRRGMETKWFAQGCRITPESKGWNQVPQMEAMVFFLVIFLTNSGSSKYFLSMDHMMRNPYVYLLHDF